MIPYLPCVNSKSRSIFERESSNREQYSDTRAANRENSSGINSNDLRITPAGIEDVCLRTKLHHLYKVGLKTKCMKLFPTKINDVYRLDGFVQ